MTRSLIALLTGIVLSSVALPARAADPCIACHEQKTPVIAAAWKESAHFRNNVGCVACHGGDQEANHRRTTLVTAEVCGSCHRAALDAHRLSKHAVGLKAGQGCTRNMKPEPAREKSCVFCHRDGTGTPLVNTECAMFLAQSPEMQRQGCGSCHRVEISCDSCHTKHGTDLAIPRDPGTCGVCHMGPDHPQLEMWESSVHGVLYRQPGGKRGPSCVTCHMDGGSHNVSDGIATGLSTTQTASLWKRERDRMIARCNQCHSPAFASRNLADADGIALQSSSVVAEAQAVVEELQRDGLLLPPPSDRPPHPLFGKSFVIGPHMLYENLSSVESQFFRLKQFYALTAFKGAFHQNPDYAHWYGNAPMKLALSEIKSEAALLRRIDTLKQRIDLITAITGSTASDTDDLRKQLRALVDQKLKGEISVLEFEKRKKKLLDARGL